MRNNIKGERDNERGINEVLQDVRGINEVLQDERMEKWGITKWRINC